MHYTVTVNIDVPRSTVVQYFATPDHWEHWREGLVRYEPMFGQPGEEGSKVKLINQLGGRTIEMVETVEVENLPEETTCIYEAPGKWMGAWNRVTNRFYVGGANTTRWELDSEFRCRGLLKIMSLLMPGMFKKATLKEMYQFKRFAEDRYRHSLSRVNQEPS